MITELEVPVNKKGKSGLDYRPSGRHSVRPGRNRGAAGTPAVLGHMKAMLFDAVLYCLFHGFLKASRGTFDAPPLAFSGDENSAFRGGQTFHGERLVRGVEAVI